MSYGFLQNYLSQTHSRISANEYFQVVCETEKKIARRILNNELSLEDSSFYKKAYDRVKGMEQFLEKKNVVVIGAGAIPATLIFAQKSGLIKSGIGLDIDKIAVSLAKELTQHLNVNELSYLNINGLDYDFTNSDVVFIANLVRGKSKLLNRLSSQLKFGDHIILREPWGKGVYLAESAIESIGSSWKVIGQDSPCPYFYSQSFYLRKN